MLQSDTIVVVGTQNNGIEPVIRTHYLAEYNAPKKGNPALTWQRDHHHDLALYADEAEWATGPQDTSMVCYNGLTISEACC